MAETVVDLNDSEILRIEKVVQDLSRHQGSRMFLEDFRKKAMDLFAQAGFGVAVKVWTTTQDGLYGFDLEIRERLSGHFDPERQVWEATHDILNLGEEGFIKNGPSAVIDGGHHHGRPHTH